MLIVCCPFELGQPNLTHTTPPICSPETRPPPTLTTATPCNRNPDEFFRQTVFGEEDWRSFGGGGEYEGKGGVMMRRSTRARHRVEYVPQYQVKPINDNGSGVRILRGKY